MYIHVHVQVRVYIVYACRLFLSLPPSLPHPSLRIDIRREPQNELHFEAGHSRVARRQSVVDRLKGFLPPEPVRSALTPPLTRGAWLEFLLIHVPILRWVVTYRPSFFIGDIISGITVAIMHIPQGIILSAYYA